MLAGLRQLAAAAEVKAADDATIAILCDRQGGGGFRQLSLASHSYERRADWPFDDC